MEKQTRNPISPTYAVCDLGQLILLSLGLKWVLSWSCCESKAIISVCEVLCKDQKIVFCIVWNSKEQKASLGLQRNVLSWIQFGPYNGKRRMDECEQEVKGCMP